MNRLSHCARFPHRDRSLRSVPRAALQSGLGLAILFLSACASPIVFVPHDPLGPSAPGEVESVLLLAGDAGESLTQSSPVLKHLSNEVEYWSEHLEDRSTSVVFLGDNVYDVGLRSPGHPERAVDEAFLASQVRVLGGPWALRKHARGIFLPGNHDWGGLSGPRGIERIGNMAEYLGSWNDAGVDVELLPRSGRPGPVAIDIGTAARVIAIDTQWWFRTRSGRQRSSMIDRVAAMVRASGDRHVVLAMHHPLVSGGKHAQARARRLTGLGVARLWSKSGPRVGDLGSTPYQELIAATDRLFKRAPPPLVVAGGHDHSLQVIERDLDGKRSYQLVSGAMSKTTKVRPAPGMLYAASQPGYMRIEFLKSGDVRLFVIAGNVERCGVASDEAMSRCVLENSNDFETVFSMGIN